MLVGLAVFVSRASLCKGHYVSFANIKDIVSKFGLSPSDFIPSARTHREVSEHAHRGLGNKIQRVSKIAWRSRDLPPNESKYVYIVAYGHVQTFADIFHSTLKSCNSRASQWSGSLKHNGFPTFELKGQIMKPGNHIELQRVLTLPLVILYGLGVTIGVGIYDKMPAICDYKKKALRCEGFL